MSEPSDIPPEESSSSIVEKENQRQKDAVLLLKEVMEYASPKERRNLINKLGAKIKSTETYYSSKAASGIKKIVDEMMIDGKDREIRFQDYPQYQPNTIRAKINSALSYIIDNLDDEYEKYKIWRQSVKVIYTETAMVIKYVRAKSRSPEIEFEAHILDKDTSDILEVKDDSDDFSNLKEVKESKSNWRLELIEFVQEDKPASQFKRMNLALNEEDKLFIKSLCQVPPHVIRVNSERITICNDPTNALGIEEDERVIIK